MNLTHIVRPDDGWILHRIGDNLCREDWTVSTEPNLDAKLNVFINYAYMMDKQYTNTKTAALFTHYERERNNEWNQIQRIVDWRFFMSVQPLTVIGDDKSILPIGVDERFQKGDIVFGICAKEKPNNRKRIDETVKLIESIDWADSFCTHGGDSSDWVKLFYKTIDYLIVTATTEGGPIPVLEALAMGVPVIAPDVGWCGQYPVIKYDGTMEDLERVIRKLIIPKDSWKASHDEIERVANLL